MAVITKRNGIIAGGAAVILAAATTMFMLNSTTQIAPGEDLQAAINSAQCGDVIELQAGANYPANITLPKKECTEFIVIRSTRAAELPSGQRIDPATQAHLLARLLSNVNAEPVVKTAAGAHHYRFEGIEFSTISESTFVYDLVRFGESRHAQVTREFVPTHLVIDRSYIHGWPNQQVQRGVSLNCSDCGVINSVVNEIKAKGMDTQAVCGWNGTLRAFVLNNYLEATGENVMFGGADPASQEMMPSNVEIRRNHVYKPLDWKGKGYTVKNLVEVKTGLSVTIDGNIIENNWGGEGQAGIGVLLTVRNQEGSAPYSTIENLVFINNTVKNTVGALNLLGTDNEKPSAQGRTVLIRNNVFDQPGTFLTINGFNSVTIENNTHLQSCVEGCNTILWYGGRQSSNFIYRNNVTDEKAYGVRDETGVEGTTAMDKWAPGYVFSGNVIATPYTSNPPNNEYPASLVITSDYRTPYTGKGADIDALLAAQAGSGVSVPTPAPSAASPSPTVMPSPSPMPTVAPLPSPSPTATPRPSPTAAPCCASGATPSAACRCCNGFRGNSGKCR